MMVFFFFHHYKNFIQLYYMARIYNMIEDHGVLISYSLFLFCVQNKNMEEKKPNLPFSKMGVSLELKLVHAMVGCDGRGGHEKAPPSMNGIGLIN